MPNPWSVFEAVPTLITFPFDWKLDMGEQFPAFKTLCLQPHSYKPRHYPCSQCGCWHKIIRHEHPPQSSSSSSSVPVVPLATPKSDEGGGEGGISPTVDCGLRTVDRGLWTALCQCETPHCPDLHLTLEDITPLEANRAKLGRALCKGLLLNSKPAQLGLPYTAQIGSWSADAVPVILTIQCDRRDFRRVLAELVARLHRPFILFGPTSAHLDAACQELLAHARAAFFALESIVLLTDHGTLHPKKPPGELFAQFTPQPKDSVREDVARQTFALAKALDSERKVRKAPPFAVFLLYCMEGLSAADIAKRCRCTSRLIFTRLKWLGTKLGRDPAELRQYSSQFEGIEQSLSDPRARNIYRKGAAYGGDVEEQAED